VYVPKIRRILTRITEKLSNYLKKRIRQLLKKKNKHLFQAVSEGSKKRLRCLIRIGADVNATGEDGEPPLYLAAQENHAREYIRTLCTMLWTVVYTGIDYVAQGNK
jgi:ankyrin repeat protein